MNNQYEPGYEPQTMDVSPEFQARAQAIMKDITLSTELPMSTYPPLTPPATPYTACRGCDHIHRVGDACITEYTRS